MTQKKIPLRKCIGCNEMKEKSSLVRVVRSQSGDISLDLSGKMPGRGAYVCKNTECLLSAKKAKRLERAFSCQISPEIYDGILKEMSK